METITPANEQAELTTKPGLVKPAKTSLFLQMKLAWQDYSKLERGILWVFFILGGGFVVLMLIATVVNLINKILG